MLTHLTLINFALADHLAIDIDQGFNVLTGETGAGKSLLLDALSASLGERTDTNYVRYGADKADITAVFSYEPHSPEASWLQQHELDDDTGEIHLRRVIFATGRSKAWINGRPSSLSELKELGRLLVQLYSQHSQQQLLEPPYPKHWLDRYSNFAQPAQQVKEAYSNWQQKHIMQDCSYALNTLDEAEQNINQELSVLIRRLESHAGRSEQLAEIHNSILNAQSELEDATANLRQFIDRQSYDPERMEELNAQLEVFHRFARKYRTQPEALNQE